MDSACLAKDQTPNFAAKEKKHNVLIHRNCQPIYGFYRLLHPGLQDWLEAQTIKTLYIKPGALGKLGKTGILKAFMTSCAMNALTEDSSAICTRHALSWCVEYNERESSVRAA